MEDRITRRSALKRMGAMAAGAAVAGSLPTTLLNAAAPVPPVPQNDNPNASTLKMDYKLVYEGPDVVFHQINDHLWVGNGHLMYNESIYLVEGENRALLIDTGTRVDHLDEIVSKFTDKPVTVALTHTHGDHAGSVKWFKEVWMTRAEGINGIRGYEGKLNFMTNHQVFDLGGRSLEVFYAPGHTADSVLFIDKADHMAISGDAFGSTNLLMNGKLSTFINTAKETLAMMNGQQIYYMLPGHFDGTNAETSKRVYDLLTVAQGVLSGKIVGEDTGQSRGLDRRVVYEGVRFNYSSRQLM